jgi:hypothetical protein
MRNRSIALFKVLVVSITVVIGCVKGPITAPADFDKGNCVGTIRDNTGAWVRGATVLLIPEGYSPLSTVKDSAENGWVDSTISDEYGHFGFAADRPGSYNLLAKGDGLYAMRQGVRVSEGARVVLNDQILQMPGSIKGVVHLQGASDHRRAIILFRGTNVYAKPIDSTGAFNVTALAQGTYTLRILTVENDYAVSETTITIAENLQTTLPCIELRKKFVPVIDSLSVAFDPVMMRAILSWPAVDTAKIKNYAIYCNRSIKNIKPIARVDKSVTTYCFDVIAKPLDTFVYEVSAIENNGDEGPEAIGKPFVAYSAVKLDTIKCAASLEELCIDSRENIFTSSGNKIIKLDSKGNKLKEFVLTLETTGDSTAGFCKPLIDSADNIYALVYYIQTGTTRLLMKFNSDLQLIKELPLDSLRQRTIAVSAAGAVMLYAPEWYLDSGVNHYETLRWKYDPQFNLIEKDTVSGKLFIRQSIACNDTTICILDNDQGVYRTVYFDGAFKEISSPINFDVQNGFGELLAFVPAGYLPNNFRWFDVVKKNLYTVECYGLEPSNELLLFFDDNLKPVARVPYDPIDLNTYFYYDVKGNWYGVSEADRTTIFKFSMAKIFK